MLLSVSGRRGPRGEDLRRVAQKLHHVIGYPSTMRILVPNTYSNTSVQVWTIGPWSYENIRVDTPRPAPPKKGKGRPITTICRTLNHGRLFHTLRVETSLARELDAEQSTELGQNLTSLNRALRILIIV